MLGHTFAICAYKESEYLEECIQSLLAQEKKTHIIMVTSTPNDHISGLSEKYHIPLYVNPGEGGITQDWNFAYKMADAKCVTIAHQDDVYAPDYTKRLYECIRESRKPIIFFTDYCELRDGEIVSENMLLKIKRIMLLPLRLKMFRDSRFIRRRILSLGSPICCPSVTYVKKNCPEVVFEHGFRADEDWQAWEKLSKLDGSFVYCTDRLTYHRIHQDSETSKILGDNARHSEDHVMFRKFWPEPIAALLTRVYGTSEKSNNL